MNEHDICREWLQIAYDDYDSAFRKPLEIICYHCQQSAEKSLKAFLCYHNAEIPKTHDTGILCRRCMGFNDSYADFLPSCEELAIYATETRYPIRIEINELSAKRSLQQALALYDFVNKVLNQC